MVSSIYGIWYLSLYFFLPFNSLIAIIVEILLMVGLLRFLILLVWNEDQYSGGIRLAGKQSILI